MLKPYQVKQADPCPPSNSPQAVCCHREPSAQLAGGTLDPDINSKYKYVWSSGQPSHTPLKANFKRFIFFSTLLSSVPLLMFQTLVQADVYRHRMSMHDYIVHKIQCLFFFEFVEGWRSRAGKGHSLGTDGKLARASWENWPEDVGMNVDQSEMFLGPQRRPSFFRLAPAPSSLKQEKFPEFSVSLILS